MVSLTAQRSQQRMSRRSFLIGVTSVLASPPVAIGAAQTDKLRIVSLNWAVSETLYAMKITPIGAAEIPGYDRLVGYPPTPNGVIDVGFQNDPNLELLSDIRPDVIFIQSWQSAARSTLDKIARVEAFTLYDRGQSDPLALSVDLVRKLETFNAISSTGHDLVATTDLIFSDCARRLSKNNQAPLLIVQALSPTNIIVFTKGSLFDSVIRHIGLENAWSKPPTLLWGSTQIGVDALADYPEAQIVWVASPDAAATRGLFTSSLWQQLPQVSAGAVHDLPLVWGFGALPTAERFARLITNKLVGSHG